MDDGIGAAAGKVWVCLHKNGGCTTAKVISETGLSRDMAQRAVGWLAREDKLIFETVKGTQKLRLR